MRVEKFFFFPPASQTKISFFNRIKRETTDLVWEAGETLNYDNPA